MGATVMDPRRRQHVLGHLAAHLRSDRSHTWWLIPWCLNFPPYEHPMARPPRIRGVVARPGLPGEVGSPGRPRMTLILTRPAEGVRAAEPPTTRDTASGLRPRVRYSSCSQVANTGTPSGVPRPSTPALLGLRAGIQCGRAQPVQRIQANPARSRAGPR